MDPMMDPIFVDNDEDAALGFIVNLLFNNDEGVGNGEEVEEDSEAEVEDAENVNEDLDLQDNAIQGNAGQANVGIQRWRNADEDLFYDNFRMTRGVYERLVDVVSLHVAETGRLLRTPVEVCLLFTIWILANPDSFRTTGNEFFSSKSSIHYHYVIMIECLRELASRYIRWPDARERDVIKHEFERQYGYPGVVGVIDGTNITVTAPLEQKRRYVNRHHQYSIIAQAVCDHNKLFRDIFVGQPGSVGDARTFSRSPLSRNLIRGPPFISEDEHLLGDGAYALMIQVMKPYVDNGNLDRRRRHHNTILSGARSIIERAFGLLKIKFRRLIKRFQSYSLTYCIDTIVASMVLHNFILLDGEDCPGIAIFGPPDPVAPAAVEESRLQGAIKREIIADLLEPDEEE